MSKNIKQVFDANPIVTNAGTDLMYFGQSPYGVGDDAAMTFTNFAAQFGSPFTPSALTKTNDTNVTLTLGGTPATALLQAVSLTLGWTGQLSLARGGTNANLTASAGSVTYSTATAMDFTAVGTAGQLLQSNGALAPSWTTTSFPAGAGPLDSILISDGTNWIVSTSLWPNSVGGAGVIIRSNGTNNVYSTATFADTYAINTILYAASANTVSGLATANNSSLSTNATGVPSWLTLTDGQVVIGSSIGAPLAGTLTAGTGISITNGHNSISISSNGANPWIDQTTTPITMTTNTGYTADAGATLITFTLPTTSAIGDWIEINGKGSGKFTIAQAAGQQINVGNVSSTLGAGGSVSSINQFDCIRLRCITANTIWNVVSQQSSGFVIV